MSSSTCRACGSGCNYCTSLSSCTVCAAGYELQAGSCDPVSTSLQGGAIAGISIGAVFCFVIIIVCIVCMCRRQQAQNRATLSSASLATPSAFGSTPATMGQTNTAAIRFGAPTHGQLGFGNQMQHNYGPTPMMVPQNPYANQPMYANPNQQMYAPPPMYGQPAQPYGAPLQGQPPLLPPGFTSM